MVKGASFIRRRSTANPKSGSWLTVATQSSFQSRSKPIAINQFDPNRFSPDGHALQDD